ncbi:uncharacterized protein FOMMEDRAFT_153815 [Fomitiporia mediterranea MF3/22]|uniref:uncharacterized protein n=1 Tax=Fomitiporia mediterranea (strain MF3/22) TaxID=694068 RepID=UPI0004407B90|nr:uncharacterized protein FOMMEDRAFT_153815 [Fomitiporia mediterranea MF3/22]EJD04741.1 hypothetical protein FOMMEDRAFT_153815 [Fomitiporia mediterranea MF3/22]
MIAYICVKACFFISTLETFDYKSLWVQDTLNWWNRQVFGSSGELLTIEPEEDKESSIVAILRAWKACKGCRQS